MTICRFGLNHLPPTVCGERELYVFRHCEGLLLPLPESEEQEGTMSR
jgi:hypothetical protein